MTLKVNDEVSILNETGVFHVLEIYGNFVTLRDEHGFDRKVPIQFIVPRQKISFSEVQRKDIHEGEKKKQSHKTVGIPQIDLHHTELELDERFLSSHEILIAQLSAFKHFSNQMMQRKIPKFRVIHGIGEGRLKSELALLIQGKTGINIHDDQIHYGKVGASIIELKLSIVKPF